MARALTPSQRRRNQDLTNIGVRGRQTGIEVEPRERGSDDMEPLENFFTSPATGKRSYAASTRKSNGTDSSSEAMDIERSPAPDPREVLSVSRSSAPRGRAPPPGRSPVRTPGLGPARRGTLPSASSPTRSEGPSTLRPQKLQRLDFSKPQSPNVATPTLEPRERRSILRSGYSESNRDRTSVSRSPERALDSRRSPLVRDARDISDELDGGQEGVSITIEDVEVPQLGEDDDMNPDLGMDTTMGDEPEVLDVDQDLLEPEDMNGEEEDIDEEVEVEDVEMQDSQPLPESPPARKRGRPPKGQGSQSKSKALKPKDGNARAKRSRTNDTKASRSIRGGTPGPLQRAREQTPHDPDAGKLTRSGRVSYKPLAYWKGERAVFKSHSRIPEIEQIIRMDDVTPMKRNITTIKQIQKKRRKNDQDSSNGVSEHEPEEEEEEPWELQEAVVAGSVKLWDNLEGVATTEEVEEELAFAANGIQARQVPGAQFMFAKTLTRPFFGTGIVELPPDGFKSWKCSRAFQMVFFVHFGKVVVEIAPSRDAGSETRFAISKGGTWQVPRGNFYAIRNETQYPAKLFFAQGREMVSQESLQPVVAPE